MGIKSVTRYRKAELIQLIQDKLKEMAEIQQREWFEKNRAQEDVQSEKEPDQGMEQEPKPARRGRPRKRCSGCAAGGSRQENF